MNKESARSRIVINRPANSNGVKTNYNRIVDQDAVKNHYEPNRFDYEGDKTPTNKIKTRGPLNKYLSNMSRLGDKDLHHGEEKTKAHYRQKARLSRKDYGEESMHNINISPKKREESKKKREVAERNREYNAGGEVKMPTPQETKQESKPVNKPSLPPQSSDKGLGPGESSTIRGLKVKRLNSKEFQERAESSPDVMKHVNKSNRKAYGEGTGNEDERASGSAQDARDAAYHKRKSDETPGNTSHYTKEPFKIPDMPSSPKKEGLSRGQKIGLGVGATGAVVGAIALRKYLKKRKAKKEAEMNKSASLFSGETKHDVNIGKETRDWIDAKGAKAGQALSKAKDYASSMKDKAAPYATKRNAQMGGAAALGAYGLYRGGKAIKGAIKNRLDERSARRKEDDRINYYKDQMDKHKDNPFMSRALASRMSKEKFDA